MHASSVGLLAPGRASGTPGPQGASATLVPGAHPLMQKLKGVADVVPGTMNSTALMGAPAYPVPLPPSQHSVLKLEKGMNTGPDVPVTVAHQRLVGSVAPLGPWIWMRNTVVVLSVKFSAMPLPDRVVDANPVVSAYDLEQSAPAAG